MTVCLFTTYKNITFFSVKASVLHLVKTNLSHKEYLMCSTFNFKEKLLN